MLSHSLQLSVPTGRNRSAPNDTALHMIATARSALVGPLGGWVSIVDASWDSGSATGNMPSKDGTMRLHENRRAFKGLDVREFTLIESAGDQASVGRVPCLGGLAR